MNQYLEALDALVASRPGFDPANYSDAASYRADQRAAMLAARDYRVLRLYVAPHAEALLDAARGSRIAFVPEQDGPVRVEYCTGQYYPTEYRAAACRLLASLEWRRVAGNHPEWSTDDIRAYARRTFGRGMAGRWFR